MQLKKSTLPINIAVFEAFKTFTHDDANVRIKGAHGLIKIIQDTDEEKVRVSAMLYILYVDTMCSLFRLVFSWKRRWIMR